MNSFRQNIRLLSLLILCSVFLTACESFHIGPKLGIKIPIEEREIDADNAFFEQQADEGGSQMFSQLNNDEKINADESILENKVYLGDGKFTLSRSKKAKSQIRGDGKYSMNFDAADLGEVSKIILSDMLQENYVINPKVRGTVTLQTTRPLHKEELLSTLEMLLKVNGAVLIKRDGIYRIEPDSSATQTANTNSIGSKQLSTGYQIKVIPLRYVGAVDMSEIIKPVVNDKAVIKVDPARNILLVAGTKNELEKILDLVSTFDVNYIASMSFGLFPLEFTEIDTTLAEIEEIFNKGELTPLTGMIRFIAIKHLNAILVVSQQKQYVQEAEKWINRLDISSGGVGEGGLVVYRVQHVDAVELADTLNEIISGVSSTKQSSPRVAPGQRVATISNKSKKTKKTAKARKRSTNGTASLEDVNIIADEPNNALIIMAEPQQYRMLIKIIKQLDVMPLQVLIDATILSVTLTDNLEHGVKWSFENTLDDKYSGVGIFGLPRDDSLFDTAAAAATSGFTYGIVNNQSKLRMQINLLAENEKINVLSTPSVMVLNNHEANILVGNEIPTRTGEFTNTSGGASSLTNTSIQMVETGVSLNVKPRVNANGVVILEIEQKVNNALAAGSSAAGSNIDSPTILKREITSTIAVVSGESIVLGGLISETHRKANDGIPLLKDIPFLGSLFGSQVKKIEKNELIIILSPQVIENKFDARKVTAEFKRKLTGIFYDKDTYKPRWNDVLRDHTGHEINNTTSGDLIHQ